MPRLLVHVEGQTEEGFVNEVLRSHLVGAGYHSVEARIVGNARQRRRRGGIRPWPSVRTDIMNHLRQDQTCIATTMVDYYALPQDGAGAWPGRAQAVASGSAAQKGQRVQDAVQTDLASAMGHSFDVSRFAPFVVMHEFEGLLFRDCESFSRAIYRVDLEAGFREIRAGFATPEDINDSPETAPSKRIEALVPGYQKPLLGVVAVLEVGLHRIRAECPHFDSWLSDLEFRVRPAVS